MFVVGLGLNFDDFCGALEPGFKFDDVSWPPGCAPEIRVGRNSVADSAFRIPLISQTALQQTACKWVQLFSN